MDNEKIQTRNIGDMYLVAALLSYGAKLVGINREDVRRQRFEFVDNVDFVFVEQDGKYVKLEDLTISDVETSYAAKSLVYPPSYPDSIRRVKSAIHGYD